MAECEPGVAASYGRPVEWRPRSGNSSVGRARPCQGRGRGFESLFPLQTLRDFRRNRQLNAGFEKGSADMPPRGGFVFQAPARAWTPGQLPGRPNTGLVAEWLCSGLQSRVRRFNSDPGLQRFGVMYTSSPRGFTRALFCVACCQLQHIVWRGFPIARASGTLSSRPGGEIGRRIRLKICRPQGRTGSIPVPGTTSPSATPAGGRPLHKQRGTR